MSIGIATSSGTAQTVDELLRSADETMYAKKQARRRGAPSAAAAPGDDPAG